MFDYRPEDFEIVRFFSYTSTIPAKDRTFYYDGMNRNDEYPNIRDKFDTFMSDLVEYAIKTWEEMTGKSLYATFNDNKTVFQLKHKYSGRMFFIGHYDLYRFIGNSVYLYDGWVFDFNAQKHSDYVHDIFCNGLGLWKKFDNNDFFE